MAKIGSLVRRFFSTISSDDEDSSSFPLDTTRQSIVFQSSSTGPLSVELSRRISNGSMNTRSCSASPSQHHHRLSKLATVESDSENSFFYGNPILSEAHKVIDRRLSAPLVRHISNYYTRRFPSATLNEADEDSIVKKMPTTSLSSCTSRTSQTRILRISFSTTRKSIELADRR